MKIIKLLMISFVIMISLVSCKSNDKMDDKTKDEVTEDKMQSDSSTVQDEMEMSDEMYMDLIAEFGNVKFVNLEEKQIEIVRGFEGDEDTLLLNFDGDIYYVDSGSGKLLEMSSLKEGDSIVAWISGGYSSGMPPQASAKIILTNDSSVFTPVLFEVKAVKKDNGYFIMETEDETVKWVIEENATPTNFVNKNVGSLDDIKEGTYCLAWLKNTTEHFSGSGIFAEKIAIVK